jgi:outer membrane protein OmpA-like peptidoglycan-associated protein/tetratricopeptide (TPR) repeat protein
MFKKVVLFGLLLCLSFSVFAQKAKPKTAGWYENSAERYYENGKYAKALPYLLKYQSFKPMDNEAKFQIGMCYLKTGRASKAQEYFDFLLNQKNVDKEVYHLMAQTLHLSHDFENAILYYKKYLAELDENDDKRFFVKDDIKRCAVGLKIIYKDKLGLVENLGDKINTSYDDFAPVFAPNYDNIIYFSSIREGNTGGMFDTEGREDTLKGEYRSDIFVSRLTKGEWSQTVALDERYNTVYHDVINGFSKDGSLVYMSKSKDMYFDYGDIYMNNFFEATTTTENFKLPNTLNSNDWDGDVFFFDNNVMFFSSDRKGGYGGKDIYVTKKDNAGKWSTPSNLGPGVNTPYDEISPFLAADGRTLFFSSNNLESMGGYDVFKVTFQEKLNNWTVPENLGIPINSAGNEDYFKISVDGLRAFFSSNRTDGFGMRDLYVVYFRTHRAEQQTPQDSIVFQYAIDNGLLSNKIGIDEAKITFTEPVETTPTDEVEMYKFDPLYYGEFGESETLEMNSLLVLNNVIRLLNKHPELKVELTSHIDNAGTAVHFNLFYSLKGAENVADYVIDQGISPNRIILKGCGANYPVSKSREIDGSIIKGGQRLNRRVEVRIYRSETAGILVEYGEPNIIDAMALKTNQTYKKMQIGISYKVQIKTLTTMLDDNVLMEYSDPMIEKIANKDIMIYTVGLVKGYQTAEELQNELIARGFTDCFIVAYKNGERLTEADIVKYSELYPSLKNMIK